MPDKLLSLAGHLLIIIFFTNFRSFMPDKLPSLAGHLCQISFLVLQVIYAG